MRKKWFLVFFLILNLIFGKDIENKITKSPKKAFYYSLVPGLGQAYNEKWLKSLIIISLELVSYKSWRNNIYIYSNYEQNDYPLKRHRYLEKRNKYAWWLGIIYVYGMIDSIVDAHLYEFNKLMEESIIENENEEVKNE
tara:strand:- start:360 stop:776 length:417 start_codon:yes stop_codon:yes gene_type:complete